MRLRENRIYLFFKTWKFMMWNFWLGGSTRVGEDRYVITNGIISDFFRGEVQEVDEISLPFFKWRPAWKVTNKKALESIRDDKDRIYERPFED